MESKVIVKVIQLCPTLCDPVDYTIHGILQARILEWIVYPFSRPYIYKGYDIHNKADISEIKILSAKQSNNTRFYKG